MHRSAAAIFKYVNNGLRLNTCVKLDMSHTEKWTKNRGEPLADSSGRKRWLFKVKRQKEVRDTEQEVCLIGIQVVQ